MRKITLVISIPFWAFGQATAQDEAGASKTCPAFQLQRSEEDFLFLKNSLPGLRSPCRAI